MIEIAVLTIIYLNLYMYTYSGGTTKIIVIIVARTVRSSVGNGCRNGIISVCSSSSCMEAS